ncbi:hypothetical protein [Bradyrhizobium sp. Bra78]|uniref:hypothetical protein n=1 Tax=Bradyrhizobium sp. Bra78 TaxID=2926010 RepID=UPI0021C9FCE7|nr:hypothetical protein [Bradyrhizobium sp. Bra78]
MSLSDFSSVLQLGVGFHAGTALLQPILEFASTPIVARAERLARIAELRVARLQRTGKPYAGAETLLNDLNDIRSVLALDRVLFFQEYKIAATANAAFALVLYALLSWAAMQPDHKVDLLFAICLIGLSAGPALASLSILWWRWRTNTSSIEEKLDIFQKAIGNS